MKILVTGGAGFISSNFILYAIEQHTDWEIINLDKLTYAGNLDNLKDVKDHPRYSFIRGDITDRELINTVLSGDIDAVINFAAESHVDRSIENASPFIDTNTKGTQILLEGARKHQVGRYVHISTDEVYGSIDSGSYDETAILSPLNPYSASKAAADLLCHAYYETYNLPVMVTRCTNNFGPRQFPEKLIPLVITNALDDKTIPVYGDGLNRRDWIYVIDHCRAIGMVLQKGKPGQIYNIAGMNEKTNLELIQHILKLLNKPDDLIQFVTDRPGHDRRYAINADKIYRELGWKPEYSFDQALADTVDWYLQNESWWRQIKSGEYASYYDRMYLQR